MIDEIKVYNIKGEYLGTFDELFSIDEEEEETKKDLHYEKDNIK